MLQLIRVVKSICNVIKNSKQFIIITPKINQLLYLETETINFLCEILLINLVHIVS